jgi:hypothetical protein
MAPYDLSYCEIGSACVILDVRRDKYLQLPPDLAQTLKALRAGSLDGAQPGSSLRRLEELGLYDPSSHTAAEPAFIQVPGHDTLVPAGGLPVRIFPSVLIALALLAVTRMAVRVVPFRRLAGWITRVQTRPMGRSPSRPAAYRVAQFAVARQVVPVRDACLPDSIALLLFLRTRHVPCALVFGVRLDPFEAHCWVQDGSTILGDTHERVSAFTPIRKL